jgi:hypothetical protein
VARLDGGRNARISREGGGVMKLWELIDRLFHKDDTAKQTAAAVTDDLKLTARQREHLYPLILAEVMRRQRHLARRVERRTLRRGRPVGQRSERATLLAQSMQLSDGRTVTWGEATVEDHLMRIDDLTKYRDGVQKTIDLHMAAVEQLRASGCRCLNDLEAQTGDDTPPPSGYHP